jgi:hypothetical protein
VGLRVVAPGDGACHRQLINRFRPAYEQRLKSLHFAPAFDLIVYGFSSGEASRIIRALPGPSFERGELLARMRAVMRRRSGAAQALLGQGAALQLDLNTREAVFDGSREALTAREFALLRALLERPGAILSREQLEQRIYGWGDEVSSNTVDVLILGIRRKFGADVIRNVRGLGWRVCVAETGG